MEAWAREWDVVVVGTGMGGATIGHALVERGHRVLFLECGDDPQAEGNRATPWTSRVAAERRSHGLWPQPLSRNSGGAIERFHAYLGSGVGGSTLLYSAALERLTPLDFEGGTVDGRDLPAWPVGFDEFDPFYDEAERLYRGGATLPDPPQISDWDHQLMAQLRSRGLQPQRLKVGIGYDADCRECMGRVCARRCKADARTVCIEPALASGRAQLLSRCEVVRLGAGPQRVEVVHARVDGHEREFRGRVVILAAGALFSPALLLRSSSADWPTGLANRSGLVGRNLMFHAFELHVVSAPTRLDRHAPCTKAMIVRDFHGPAGLRLGTFQSLGGGAVGSGEIEQHLRMRWQHLPWLLSRPAALLRRLTAWAWAWRHGRGSLFATAIEDAPDPENRVVLSPNEPSGILIHYAIPKALHDRSLALRARLHEALRPWRLWPMHPQAQPNVGHACGTCRFGDDPATSVLDRNNKAHGLSNLYVVDASFMPTSGAANPALTIAANARRAGLAVDAQLKALR
jgi:choline dehydrogenase-like flavoprotein